tara:strand:- start:7713 stop:9518 length:1806 start_codon:yes stop_codon:yes gene_type:complete
MSQKKNIPIKYTDRDFNSIRQSLVDYAKRYYPNTFQDFNEASFGALMLDTVAYVGDILSYYVDYQANESFLDTSVEIDNIIKIGRQSGYIHQANPSSTGMATFFALIPANVNGLGPDEDYFPILQKGSEFSTTAGDIFTLNEDVVFGKEEDEIIVAETDSDTGLPTSYAVKAHGQVISGQIVEQLIEIGEFEKFLRIELEGGDRITEIIKVEDDEGNEFFQVNSLAQNVVYKSIANRDSSTNKRAGSLIKPHIVPRRFVVERDGFDSLFLQFGYGTQTENLNARPTDPSKVVLKVHGKEYISDDYFDPTRLLYSDKFGIAPSNTTLRIVYRLNTDESVNSGIGTLTEVTSINLSFDDEANLDSSKIDDVRNSIEVDNEEAIVGDVADDDEEEIKRRIFGAFASQNRAVTRQDYETLCYNMDRKFGAVKRVKVLRDPDSAKRNINIYVISEDENGQLIESNSAIKQNLKTWLGSYKMMNDTVDILNTDIINIGINFELIGDLETNKFDILQASVAKITEQYSGIFDIGESIFITDIYKVLKDVDGVVDVTDVKIVSKNGGEYSDYKFNVTANTSADGRYVTPPENAIFEIKFFGSDIKGSIK